MRAVIRVIEYPHRGDHIDITPLYDLHVGNAACDEVLLRQTVKRIQSEKHHYWIGGGDYCLPLDTEILTKRGFRKLDDLEIGESVLAFDGKNTVWTPLRSIYLTPEQDFVQLKSKTFEAICTSGHGWWVEDSHKDRWTGKRRRRAAPWPRKIEAGKLRTHHKIVTAAICLEEGTLNITPDEAALLGWLVTDGCLRVFNEHRFNASISQSKEPYRSKIRERFKEWFTKEYNRSSGRYNNGSISVFNIKTKKLRGLFERLGTTAGTLKTDFPRLVPRLSLEARQSMMTAMIHAEGWQNNGHWWFSQLPGPVMDAFQILATLSGIRLGRGKFNKNGVHQIPLRSKQIYATVADLEMSDVGHGPAWCPQTDCGSIVIRQGRQITITGNCDFINRKDRRHKETSLASWLHGVDDLARMQRDRAISILEPIKDKCLGLLRGNHEGDFLRYYEVDIYASMVDRLRIDHKTKIMLGVQGFILLRTVRKSKGSKGVKGNSWTVKIYCHHGYGGGRLEGGHALALGRMFKDYDCDIGLMGHRHVKQVLPRAQTSVTRDGRVHDRYQVGAFCGSFLKSYSEDEVYPEEKGLPSLPLGPIRLRLWPAQHKIEVTV